MSVADKATVKESTANINLDQDAVFSKTLDVLMGAELALTSANGGMSVTENATITNASIARIALGETASFGDELNILRASALSLTAGGDVVIRNSMKAAGLRDTLDSSLVRAYAGVNIHADGSFRRIMGWE